MKHVSIYALCKPGTRTVRYIGKSGRMKQRFAQHLRTKEKTPLGYWIRSLVARGEVPNLIVFREVLEEDGSRAEMSYIRLARGFGMKLTNSTDGGDGVTMTPETRKKIGNKSRGRKQTEAAKENISKKNTGKRRTAEEREAQSARQMGSGNPMFGRTGENSPIFGHICSPETRQKIGDKNRGENSGMFGRSGDKSPTFGRKRPKEETDAMSKRRKGVPLSPEWCAALSKAQTGRKHSEETKAKQSEARKASWARRKERDQEIEWALAPYTLE